MAVGFRGKMDEEPSVGCDSVEISSLKTLVHFQGIMEVFLFLCCSVFCRTSQSL